MNIPSHFDNFEQRQLQRGLETRSTMLYQGYEIILRSYSGSGIYYKISMVKDDGKRIKLRMRNYNFCLPDSLLQKAKDWVDENLIKEKL